MAEARAGDGRLLALMAGLLAVLFLKGLAVELPPVRETNPPGAFDATRALERLARVLGDERPHPVDSEANDDVRARLLAEVEALGYAPQVRDDFVCRGRFSTVVCARVQNVLFRAGPEGGDAVMIASHYDSVPAGPGAADDGAGVAASLEIAAQLAERPPAKPVLFLITDGEEMGLLGAKSFVETDPLRDQVSRVINLEARGVSGPVLMFETGTPNGADVADFAHGAARPFANSIITDVYKLLPNDTDVSEFLKLDYGALNFAFNDVVERYHTPGDNLAALDPRSVQHMGDLALSGLEASLRDEASASESEVVFTDILSRWMVVMPQWLGQALVALGGLAALFAFARAGVGGALRALAAPPLLILGAGAIVYGLQALLGAMRPDVSYWSAHPGATQALAYVGALVAGAVIMTWIAPPASSRRLAASGWFWIAALAFGASFVAPGITIFFALSLAVYALGVVAAFVAPPAERIGAIAAAILLLIIVAPALHITEIGLGFALAAVPAILAAILFVPLAPLAMPDGARPSILPMAIASAGLLAAFAAAALVPAYSKAKPRPLNLQYYADADADEARWLIQSTGEPAPAALAAVEPFAFAQIDALNDRRPAAPAPYLETAPPSIEILESPATDDGRRVRVRIDAAGADQVVMRLPASAGAQSVGVAGRSAAFDTAPGRLILCVGRACDGAEFEIELAGGEPAEWTLIGLHYGLPFAAAPLVSARPDWASPIQNGDLVVVSAKVSL